MLFRFDPFDDFDRTTTAHRRFLAMDAVRDDDSVTVYFDVPGVKAEDLDVTAQRNEITVELQRRWFDADKKTLIREREQGSFRRQIYVGESLDTDQMKATLDQGVLTVTIPVSEKAKPRKVEIDSYTEARELETSS